jgi:pimeloyl-ACP methyl ester carboxylesterase
MRRLRVFTVALVLAAVPAAAQWRTVDTFTKHGAHGLIVVPENWNGGLFVYAHGYSADHRILQPFPADLSPDNFLEKLDLLFAPAILPTLYGYAVATTTFRSVGWYVKDSIKDLENVRRRFVKKHGEPTYTYLWGHSGGGLVTATVIEYLPDTYDGAMPMCGPNAGARRNFNAAFDLRAVYEHVCGDVPGAQFTCGLCEGSKRRCLADADCADGRACSGREEPPAPEEGLSRQCTKFLLAHPDRFNENPTSPGGGFVDGAATACFGSLDGTPPPTPEQAARKDRFLRTTQIPESFIASDLFFASIGMAEVVHRRTRGRHPWGNADVTYAPPTLSEAERAELNASIVRVREDKAAVTYMRRWYEPRGETDAKVLTIHALDDGLVIPENETKYRQAFETAGRADQLVQLTTTQGGHCGFVSELFPAITALADWVERGVKPSTAALMTACPEPACHFTDVEPGPWGLRIVEREQRGAPLDSLVCTGLDGDCPAGATCAVADGYCTGS